MARKKWPVVVLAVVAALAAAIAVAFALPSSRAALTRAALGVYLVTKGFDLQNGDIAWGGGTFEARDVLITDRSSGALFFSAARIHATYGVRGRRYGLSSLA